MSKTTFSEYNLFFILYFISFAFSEDKIFSCISWLMSRDFPGIFMLSSFQSHSSIEASGYLEREGQDAGRKEDVCGASLRHVEQMDSYKGVFSSAFVIRGDRQSSISLLRNIVGFSLIYL